MENRTVKRRIFLSNALMVLVTLVIFLVINLVVVKIYSESIEADFRSSAEQYVGQGEVGGLDDLLEDWTIHRNEFLLIFGADGLICIAVLILISQIFTKRLVDHITKPLDLLEAGAKRIRENDLTGEIQYTGDLEFEQVCHTFNDMQRHILTEQEKNRKYEKARTDMIAGISHDLRTPLTVIRGSIKGMIDGVATTPQLQEKFLQTAYRRTGDMEVLLNQLFYFSKMETGNLPIHPRNLNLSEFMEQYVKSKEEFVDPSREYLTLHTNDLQEDIWADPEQLQRILDNLLENSRKYAQADPLKIKIELKRSRSGIELQFSDNGEGVPEEKLPHIFEEFYRGDESRNKKEGNGLGLYIVKYLMQAMKGHVYAENREGLLICLDFALAERMKGESERGGQTENPDCGR